MPVKGLRGLPGLNTLSDEERQAFMLANEDQLKQFKKYRDKERAAELLFNNQQFVNKFGRDKFDAAVKQGISYEDRNNFLRSSVINDAFTDKFSPFSNGKRDNSRGLGRDWETYNGMSLDAKEELLNSEYKTPQQLQEEQRQRTGLFDRVADFFLGDAIQQYKTESNDKILQKIYSKDADNAGDRLASAVNQAYLNPEVVGKTDSETKALFVKAITPGSYVDSYGMPNSGIREYAARYGKGGENDISSEMKDFSVDDMRKVLAKKAVYEQYLDPQMASTALNNEAQRYIKDHQSGLRYLGLLANDIWISALSYTADKVNGIYNLGLMAQDKFSGVPIVYMDDEGSIIDPNKNKVIQGRDGGLYYIGSDGKRHTVHQEKIARSTLHNLGKNTDGSDDDSWLNPQYWTRAEQFGTLDENEQLQYEKLGTSPYKVVYDPLEDTDVWYESFKMMSFGLADAASMFIPFGIGMAGRSLGAMSKAGSVGRGLGKAMNYAGRTLSAESKFGRTAQGLAGAGGIAYAYQRGAFQETLAKNLASAEEALIDASKKDIYNSYQNNDTFRSQVDKRINARAAEMKAEYMAQASADTDNRILDEATIDKMVRARAQDEVLGEYVARRAQERKGSDEYAQLQQKAIDEAGDAATTAFLPEAIKYGLVNTIGFRKFLYSHPTSLAQKASKNFEGLIEKGVKRGEKDTKRLGLKSKFTTFGDKSKQFGKILGAQAWGGVWTNGTDDMMVDAAERINDDSYNRYINAYVTGEPVADTYGLMDGLYSYMRGLNNSLGQETTWNAATVGGLGSVVNFTPHMANIAHLASREGREAFRRNFQERYARDEDGMIKKDKKGNPIVEKVSFLDNWRDRAAFFIQNGALNEYYGRKQNEKNLQEHADFVNNLLDKWEDFDAINDLLAAAKGVDTANSKGDTRTMQYLHALKAAATLENLGNSEKDPFTLSSVVQEHKTLIDRASKMSDRSSEDALSEKEVADLLSQYYKNNPGLVQSEENNQMALEDIQKNAQMLQEAIQAREDADKEVQKAEANKKTTFSPDVREKMKTNKAMTNHWQGRVDSMRSDIGDVSDVDGEATGETLISTLGGKRGAEAQRDIYKTQVEQLQELQNAQKNATARFQTQYDDAVKAMKESLGENTLAKMLEAAELRAKLENSKEQEKYYSDLIDLTTEKSKKIEDALNAREEGAKDVVLSADEIFALDPLSRARMMNEENQNLYTKAQRKQIEKLRRSLDKEDLDGAQKIQDIALLIRRIRANEDAYTRMANNPEAATEALEEQRVQASIAAYKLINKRNAQIAADYLSKAVQSLSRRSNVGEAEINDYVYNILRTLNTQYLDIIDKDDLLPDHHVQVKEAKAWGKTLSDIMGVINHSDREEGHKRNLINSIANYVATAPDRKGIMDTLEKAVTDLRESDHAMAKDIENLLTDLQKIGYQRNATIIESRKEKEKREEEQKKRDEEAKRELEKAKTAEVKPAEPSEDEGSVVYEINTEAVSMSTLEDLLKFHPDDEIDDVTKEALRSQPEKIRRQIQEEVQSTIDFLNGIISARDYLDAMGYDTAFFDAMSESTIEKEAKAEAGRYKAFFKTQKSTKTRPTSEERTEERTADEETKGRFEELNRKLTDDFKSRHSDPNSWISVKMGIEDTGTPIIYLTTYDRGTDWQTTTQYRVRDGKLQYTEDGTIWKDRSSESSDEIDKFFEPYLTKAITPQTAASLMTTDKEEGSVNKGTILYGAASDPQKGNFIIKLSKGVEGTSLKVISFEIEQSPRNATHILTVNSNDWKQEKAALEDVESSGIDKNTPFHADLLALIDGKWCFIGNFEGSNRDFTLEVSDSFNLDDAIDRYRGAEELRYAGTGSNVSGDNFETIEVDGVKGVRVKPKSIDDQASEMRANGQQAEVSDTSKLDIMEDETEKVEDDVDESPTYLGGNAMPEFLISLVHKVEGFLEPVRKLIRRRGRDKYDSMNSLYDWFEKTNTHLQNIIDDELPLILKEYPSIKVKFMAARGDRPVMPRNDGEPPIEIGNHLMLVLDMDDKETPLVKTNHKGYNNGGVITSGGKQYLLIGVVGFGNRNNPRNSKKIKAYSDIFGNKGLLRKGMDDFFKKNPSETFYVGENLSTEIVPKSMVPGYIVHQLENDSAAKYRNLSELLEDKDGKGRNPHRLTWKTLGWMIQERTKFLPIRANASEIMKLRDFDKNAGNSFVLVPAGNGKKVAIAIQPRRYNEINAGDLKTKIDSLIDTIGAPESTYDQRLAANLELSRYLYIQNDKDNMILISPNNNRISLVIEGKIAWEKNPKDASYTLKDFRDGMVMMNPRIQFSPATFDEKTLKMYDQAGALKVNTAKLGTVGTRYLIYPVNAEGKADKPSKASVLTVGSYDLPKPQNIFYKGIEYQELNGKFYLNNQPIDESNTALLEALKYNLQVIRAEINPSADVNGWKYYILSQGEHPEVIRIKDKDYEVVKLSDEEAKKHIEKVNAEREKALKERKAAEELKNKKAGSEAPASPSGESGTRPQSTTPAAEGPKVPKKKKPENPLPPQNPNTQSFSQIIRNPKYRMQLYDLIDEVAPEAPDDYAELEKFFKDKGVPVEGIGTSEQDLEAWYHTIRCKFGK